MAGTLADVLPIEILPEIDRRELASHMTLRKFKQDEVVYHQGDPAAHWFVVFEGQVEDFAFLDVTSRLAKYLVEVARLGRSLPLTQDDLASAIGSTRMTVNKLLADFERRGFIKVERRNVRVLDENSLLGEIRV